MNGASATSFPAFAMSPPATRDALIVSLHDVAPATYAASKQILDELLRNGVAICSLLVVPDYHHRGSFAEDSAFVRWLQELEARGHEIVIHGYFHERPRGDAENLRKKFLTRVYTNDEGEFYDLDYDEAFRRITLAQNEFVAAGLKPRGFIAPAWLLGTQAERAAAAAEMEYTTRFAALHDLRSGETFPARTLVYSVRNHWRRVASLAGNAALCRHLVAAPLARVSIHPPDYVHPQIWRQILRLIEELAEGRTVTTYRDWIAEKRAHA